MCEVVHRILEQILREKWTDIALISEPYKKTDSQNYLSFRQTTQNPASRRRFHPRFTLQQFTDTLNEIAQDAMYKSNVVIAGSSLTKDRGRTLLETFANFDVALPNTLTKHV